MDPDQLMLLMDGVDTNQLTKVVENVIGGSTGSFKTIVIALIGALPVIITALARFWKVTRGVNQVHLAVNSRMDRLLEAEHGQGIEVGRAAQRAETETAQKLVDGTTLTREQIDELIRLVRSNAQKEMSVTPPPIAGPVSPPKTPV